MHPVTPSKVRVLVTGVGAIIGQGIVKSLRQSAMDVVVVGLDKKITPLAQSLCDISIEKPAVEEDSDAYLRFWLQLVQTERIDLVIPGLEVDVFYLNQHRRYLCETSLALNAPSLISLSSDKWFMSEFLQKEELAWIPGVLPESWQDCYDTLGAPPYILKPRAGNGSRGIVQLDDCADFLYWTQKVTVPFLVQKKVGTNDSEYTAAAFGLGDGTSLAPLVMRRTLSVAGNTQYAEVCEEPAICELISQLSQRLRPLGPTNYQFRQQQGCWYLLEINPRISSSNSLRTAFGYNEAEMCITHYVYKQLPAAHNITKGRGWRYYEDYVQ